jgi:glycerol-3-phosphate acyltransferase PlsY
MTDILLILGGYLFGSISAAIVVCKLMGLPDPRTEGSRNPGTTNVLRLGGKKAAILTLAGDMLTAFLGHLYPVFFGFQGGKGVATALGVFFGLHWQTGLAVTAIWIVMALLFRISSLSALTAMLLAPVLFWRLQPEMAFVYVTVIITVMLFWRHRSNIRDLLSGQEGRIGQGSNREQQ